MFLAPPPTTLLEHIVYVFNALIHAVKEREPHCWVVWRVGPQLRLRMERLRNRVEALVKRIEAGSFRAWAGRVAAAPRREMDPVARQRLAEVSRLWAGVPRGWAWLCPLVPSHVAVQGGIFENLLRTAEMQALLAASAKLRQMLRPFCRMIGADPALLEVAEGAPVAAEGAVAVVAPVLVVEAAPAPPKDDGPVDVGLAFVPFWQRICWG